MEQEMPQQEPQQGPQQAPQTETKSVRAMLDAAGGVAREHVLWLHGHPYRTSFIAGTIALITAVIFLGSGAFRELPFFVPASNYAAVYTLVNDKISQHGAIVVNLPDGVSKTGAEANVSFEPEISGEWVASSLERAIVYRPSKELLIGKHYLVSLETEDGVIKKDFLVDEDPAITNIFPLGEAEADLASAITIIFNRPMVPLTTLSETEGKDIPVVITPATPGKFKWITTRTLQFIPERGLWGSAHYTVAVGDGFISMDGLPVASITHSFTTKALRLERASETSLVYNQPIDFRFNQPVDLERTSREVTVVNMQTNSPVPFALRYGVKSVWSDEKRGYEKVEDPSVVSIVPEDSRYGHANVWNFSTSYVVKLQSVYPVGGDIALTGSYAQPASQVTVTTGSALKDVRGESENQFERSLALFNPDKKVIFTFHEDIDLERSVIRAKGLMKTEYGEMCEVANDEEIIGRKHSVAGCKKVQDRTQIIATFDPSAYSRGERVAVSFEKLVNAEGYQVNADTIVHTLTVYPELRITKSAPSTGDSNAAISELVLCTNVPLKPQDAKEFYQNFKANNYIVFGRWEYAYREDGSSWRGKSSCAPGEYVNRIRYGLLPQEDYILSVAVEDMFGQKASLALSLHTMKAPRFYLRFQNLQKVYNVTTPEKTTLTFATENFDYADMLICKVSPERMLRLLPAESRRGAGASDAELGCIEEKRARIPLKSDQWVNQYFQVDIKDYFLDPRGQFVVSFSHPRYTNEKGTPINALTYVSVTNLAVADKRVKWTSHDYLPDVPKLTESDTRGSVFWVSRIGSLEPVGNAKVSVYQYTDGYKQQAPPVLAETGTTNANGLVEFPLVADMAGATITAGDESAIISTWTDTLNEGWSQAFESERMYLYTDRPIYRPGQEVFLKGLYRVNFDGDYEIFREQDVEIRVFDSKGDEILEQKVPVSAYGTIAASVTLPKDAPLGIYRIESRGGFGFFSVEEYVGAAFETKATADKEEYIAGESAKIDISGAYYFGAPVEGGSLEYSLTSQDYYFDRYTDEYFSFGSGWYDCYDCGYGDAFHKSGSEILDEKGEAHIELPLNFAELFSGADGEKSKIFVLHGTIKDKQGRAVSFQKSFIVHRGGFYAGVKPEPSFVAANEPFNIRIKTVDVKGEATSESVTVTVSKVSWQAAKRQEVDGGYYARSERALTEVSSNRASTNYSGDGSLNMKLPEPGEYEISVVGKDRNGNEVTGKSGMYVYGAGSVSVRPTNNATLDIASEKRDVKVGDTASFIIQNPYPHAKAFISIERGRIFSYEVVDIRQSIYEYRFPVVEEHTPNVYASVVLLGPEPGIKYGELRFTTDRKQKELTIDVSTTKNSYLPGEKVELTVRTKDARGTLVPAHVSLAVADLSILALKGNPKKDPLSFFYDNFQHTIAADSNIKNLLFEVPIPSGTKGGDGGSESDLAKRKRGEFRDTAFWKADVVTNAEGIARVSFTLPDNLTRWQIEALGITKDTKVGVRYLELVAQKAVMTVPLMPRFVVPGDQFLLGAKVFNQTGVAQTLDLMIESPSLIIEDTPRTRKKVGAGDSVAVYFKVKAPLDKVDGAHAFTLSAKNDAYDDTVELGIPITSNETYESTATAGMSSAEREREYLYVPDNVLTDRGGLTVKTSATLAVYLSDAIKYLFEYSYGCSEQLASKLSAIAIAKRALAVPNVGSQFEFPHVTFDGKGYTADEAVEIGLAQIYDSQTVDGGFAYYKGLKASPHLTVAVLSALLDARETGYSIRSGVLERAAEYLYNHIPEFKKNADTDSLILAAYVLSRVDAGSSAFSTLMSDVQRLATTKFLSDTASSNTLGYLALLASSGETSASFKEKVFASLMNRVDIDSRGAYVRTNSNISWFSYETPEKDTALLLKALVADKREYAETDEMIRWLLASRARDGSWGSTNTSVAALDALSSYLLWKRETESNFTLETLLDEASVSSTTFTASNILSTIEKFVAIADIKTGVLHALTFKKTDVKPGPNTFYYDMSLKYYLPVENIAPRDEGIALTRAFYSLTDKEKTQPIATAKVGEVVRGVLTVISPKERRFVAIEDVIPAGFELVNFSLATEDQTQLENEGKGGVGYEPTDARALTLESGRNILDRIFSRTQTALVSLGQGNKPGEGVSVRYQKFPPDFEELRDDRVFLFAEHVPAGAYRYEYYVRATTPGTFNHVPAIASEMYFPENFGRTGGAVFTVRE